MIFEVPVPCVLWEGGLPVGTIFMMKIVLIGSGTDASNIQEKKSSPYREGGGCTVGWDLLCTTRIN
jgi:hypothetical protein